MNFWWYRQLHHFFETHGHSIRDPSSITSLEQLFLDDKPIPHMVSELYRLLGSAIRKPKHAYIRRWEKDLGHELTETQLTHLYQLIHSSFIDSKTQKSNYKILSHWYQVPEDLVRIYPSGSELCWRGCGHRGTLIHAYSHAYMVGLPHC